MLLFLGNLTVSEIENRLGIKMTDEHREELNRTHQDKVNDTPLGDGCWHCFDVPFMLMCGVADTAVKMRDIFQQYTFTRNVSFQIGWER